MFKSNIKIAGRNLLKHKGFTILNIAGLALGLTICMLIVFYVQDEIGFDKFNENADRIFRVNTDIKTGDAISSRAITAPAIATALGHFPEVEKTVRLMPETKLVKKGNEFINEDKLAYCDSSIFSIFSLPLVYGNAATALTAPNSVVISENTALKYFDRTNVVGQSLSFFHDSAVHTITAVMRDMPPQSHFHFDMLLSMHTVGISNERSFGAIFPFSTYILLRPGANYKNLEAKFPSLLKQNLSFLDEMEKKGDYIKINLTPLTNIHLRSNRTNELGANGNIQYVNIFILIATFILLIACINFINLSTARFASRAKEAGIHKVLGASRKNLIVRFLCESYIITIAATIVALLAASLLLPLFNQLAGKDLLLSAQKIGWFVFSLITIIAVVGLIAGSYPAFFLSSFQPANVLKGKLATGFKKSRTRNVLVVFQFAMSIFMIAATIVIYNQLHYIQHKELGFDRDQVLIIKNMNDLGRSKTKILQQEIKQLPAVRDASLSSFLPTGNRRWINFLSGEQNGLQVQCWPVDEHYISTMGMTIADGRNFSDQLATDSAAMIINKTAAKMLGIAKDPLNRPVDIMNMKYNIIAVVKDFNFSSLRDNITPLAMVLMTPAVKKHEGDWADNLAVKINAGNIPAVLATAKNKWKTLSGNQPFDYSFMNEEFDAIYRQEQRTGKLFLIFTALTIIIACLGLFGLAAYAAEQRTKEISIRKILGADVSTIVAMLSKDFVQLVVIAVFIATPIAWFSMQKWLEGFAYRTVVDWWVLFAAAAAAILISFLTISFQSIKAANTNPVNNLRND